MADTNENRLFANNNESFFIIGMLDNSTMADTNENRLVADNESLFIIAMTVSLFSLSSNLFSSCFLHTYLKKLHSIIKLILTILCGYTLICCTITIVILLYFKISSQQTITVCGLLQLTTTTPAILTFHSLCIISVVRYHMTWKINQLELFKKHKILLSVGAVYVIEHILGMFFFIIAHMDFSMTQPSTACAGKDIIEMIPALAYFQNVKNAIVCSIGITYNVKLIKLLKKRKLHSVGPRETQMIPWKSTNSDDPDVKVPIRATIVTLSLSTIGIARMTYINIFNKSPIHWIESVVQSEAMIGVVMPVLLFLTIRAHKKKKNLVVPKGLMYHNDLYLNEECLESEENYVHHNDIFAIDPKIFRLDHFSDIQKDNIDEEANIEIHHALFDVKPELSSILEGHLETKNNTEQNNDLFAIDPNIFALDHFSNFDKKEEAVVKIHHPVIHVKPAPPHRTFSAWH